MKRLIWLFFLPIIAFAKPKGAEVVSGTAELKEAGAVLEIRTSDRAIVNWDEFSIHAGETTHFIQPSSTSAVLNRVAQGVTQIDGLLQANGQVYLINPRGVIIGKGGRVDAAGFVATTLNFDDEDFFKNRDLLFKGKTEGRIVNLGKIKALGGDVFLLAKAVVNEGSLEAPDGIVGIVAAEEVLLKPSGERRIFISPKKTGEKQGRGIENKGSIEAAQAELRADGNVYRLAINQEGVIEATGTEEREMEKIFLVADKGTSVSSGKLIAKMPIGREGLFTS